MISGSGSRQTTPSTAVRARKLESSQYVAKKIDFRLTVAFSAVSLRGHEQHRVEFW
jgi:hypothetical protein